MVGALMPRGSSETTPMMRPDMWARSSGSTDRSRVDEDLLQRRRLRRQRLVADADLVFMEDERNHVNRLLCAQPSRTVNRHRVAHPCEQVADALPGPGVHELLADQRGAE